MRARRWPLVVIGVLVVMAAGLLVRQYHTGTILRAKIAAQQVERQERKRLFDEHQRLVASRIPAEELARLQAERAAISALRAELNTMKRRAAALSVRSATPAPAVPGGSAPVDPSLADGPLSPEQWKNVGDATPETAFESALWAAAGGDVEMLTPMLSFDDEARTKAESIFARLPGVLRMELGTSERLIALLAAKDVPLGSAQITATYPLPTGTNLMTELKDTGGKTKQALFTLRREGSHWRFVVPSRAVDRYAAMLQAPPPAVAADR